MITDSKTLVTNTSNDKRLLAKRGGTSSDGNFDFAKLDSHRGKFRCRHGRNAGLVKGVASLDQVAKAVPVPIIAIGGISLENVSELLQTGVHGIAVISSVCCQEDPEQATKALYQKLRGGV